MYAGRISAAHPPDESVDALRLSTLPGFPGFSAIHLTRTSYRDFLAESKRAAISNI
jgi:hypothetical protein